MPGRITGFKKQLAELSGYFSKFAVVGLAGIVINQGSLTLFVSVFELDVEVAGIIAIELSILHNFLLNNFWTWRNKTEQSFVRRFLKYHAVTLVSGGVNYIVLLSLTWIGLHYFIANLIGIGLGMLVNFGFNHFWTFKP